MILLAAHDHDLSAMGPWQWLLVAAASLAVIWVIWRAVVLTVRPGEEDPEHIKRSILLDEEAS